ncbi:MAG: MetQ/NlpA family ABC transporter substrate-binding protein [Bacillota bacterium]
MSKRLIPLVIAVLLLTVLFSQAVLAENEELKVGATAIHAEILNVIEDDLAEAGIDLEIVEFTDYVTPNIALADGSIDANYFQHIPYLEKFKEDRNLDLTHTVKVNIYPFGLYSKKLESLSELPDGATIALPNDPTNEGRALLILENAELIKIDKEAREDLLFTPMDIVENPKNLKFEELEAAQLPRVLPDVDAAFINTNYALDSGLDPVEDTILRESKDSPYANVVAVRTEDKDDPRIQKLNELLTSDKVKNYINEEYEGAIVPAF